MSDDFATFMRTREAAARAYTAGDPEPLRALSARVGQATFFDPGGGFTEGAEEVIRTDVQGARSFGPDGTTHFEIHDQGSSQDLAFWTGFQHAVVAMGGRKQEMKIRITEVFRRDGGD